MLRRLTHGDHIAAHHGGMVLSLLHTIGPHVGTEVPVLLPLYVLCENLTIDPWDN